MSGGEGQHWICAHSSEHAEGGANSIRVRMYCSLLGTGHMQPMSDHIVGKGVASLRPNQIPLMRTLSSEYAYAGLHPSRQHGVRQQEPHSSPQQSTCIWKVISSGSPVYACLILETAASESLMGRPSTEYTMLLPATPPALLTVCSAELWIMLSFHIPFRKIV